MDLRTYRANSLRDAMRLVREELGPDAAILHTRRLRPGIFQWLAGTSQIEVTATADAEVLSNEQDSAREYASSDDSSEVDYASDDDVTFSLSESGEKPATIPFSSANFADRKTTVDQRSTRLPSVKHAGSRLQDNGLSLEHELATVDFRSKHRDDLLAQLVRELLAVNLDQVAAEVLVMQVAAAATEEAWQNPTKMRELLLRQMECDIPIGGPIRLYSRERRVVALVGPTGVGKTTTIAKLAAKFRLEQGARVGLITVDTYRIAAVDQLQTYATIMQLPLEVVNQPRDMTAALERFADFDLVLIDTAGRSPRDGARLQELRSMLDIAQPDEVHLVLASVASREALQSAREAFERVGATSLVITKLDEAASPASLLPVLRDFAIPLSYTTSGQNVPEDIRPADRRQLARQMLYPRTELS
ncbi:GTP-binding signal recognition particle SRP54 G-domain protein [Pirellula staleyi DSM 6068]|uniref:Flagellar biosynthesis protein FlhF n=1 Tax=Pirellula staleyi (strain ATCC 27377 / DSM 6068 / ICPB 4128) TaxID=530564 RepID=D2QZ27_PIRSD|nr:flagellar biosynthesis protein FlhF [Pirellula staleyi]ADB18219.1 GTP-binding signal recognition particle SRP54 G-domain protein [Pirellula staleyi DSM 6068]